MTSPKNATTSAGGYRLYKWQGGDSPLNQQYGAVEPSDLLSVTSVFRLAGMSPELVSWMIANACNVATGTRKVTTIGPRGGVREKYVRDGEFPGEFVRRLMETEGNQDGLDNMRKWLRSAAEEPRDVAAVRGSIVHKLIELGVPLKVLSEDMIRQQFAQQWAQERRRAAMDVLPDDVNFVYNAVRQYWDMRASVPFVIVAREPQVYSLRVGFGGSADTIIWFLGYWREAPNGEGYIFEKLPGADDMAPGLQISADKGQLTLAAIEAIGGALGVGDWKTSKAVYSSHVIQITAYMAADFVAEDGVIDPRLSDILAATSFGLVVHIRPDVWGVDLFEFRQDVLGAFYGCVAYARFLALHQSPQDLFIHSLSGKAESTEASEEVADDGE